MFHFRWLKRPTPKPFYYSLMNPEERVIWEIIVRYPSPVPFFPCHLVSKKKTF